MTKPPADGQDREVVFEFVQPPTRPESDLEIDDDGAFDVGTEMAAMLLAWRPEMDADAVSAAVMHALERYSIEIEGPGEVGLRGCLYRLSERINARHRSI